MIQNIPELYRKAEVVDQLARRIGRVKEIQLAPRLFYEGDYVRECGDGVWEEKDKQWGTWKLAQRREIAPEQQGDRAPRGGRTGGRGRGRAGRGTTFRQRTPPRKRSSEEAGLETGTEDGEGTSPLKQGRGENEDHVAPTARMNLNLALSLERVVNPSTVDGLEKISGSAMVDGPASDVPPLPPTYVSPRDAKKAKKSGSPLKNDKEKMALLAGSSSERRQAQ
uniref:Uncharacterized protein n=1 Tax=Aegilops tauschii TaxID=37682 RepID=M8ASP8_AEGTA